MFGMEAPRRHPWSSSPNPMSYLDWYLDSFYTLDERGGNAQNYRQMWSCFEPKLLAKAKTGRDFVTHEGPGNEDLFSACRMSCPWYPGMISEPRPSLIGAAEYRAYGCVSDPDPWGYDPGGDHEGNGYEVVEFWIPEYQVEINNYGLNRIAPEQLSPTGSMFTRSALLSQKTGTPESQIKKEAGNSYPVDLSEAQLIEPRQDPYLGQGVATSAMAGGEDKAYAHIVRTWVSIAMGSKQQKTDAGWEVDPEFSVYDALPKPAEEHDPVNVWTEYGMFDVLTSVPYFSYRIRPDAMEALFGSQEPISEKILQTPGFWQEQGAAAFRASRWPDIFKPLKTNFEIKEDSNPVLREAVWKGGYELFPLVTRNLGFGTPQISSAAVFARRALYIAGARSPKEKGGDASGTIAGFFAQGADKGRIITFTVDKMDKGRDIDKMQLLAPKRPKDGTRNGGIPPTISECLRSQNIPNLINADSDLDEWVDENLPRKLNGYFSDYDFISEQAGSITLTYWNRRIGCFCDRCGIPFGSHPIMLPETAGDGDRIYDRRRIEYCRYPLLVAWNAWAKKDTFDKCQANGHNEGFYNGAGLRDNR